jgi:YesN/AraC family two-component response regulator
VPTNLAQCGRKGLGSRRVGERGVAKVRVLIIDDHAVVRAGLRLLLEREDGIEAVGEAGNAHDAVGLAERLSPDVVLMDVTCPA